MLRRGGHAQDTQPTSRKLRSKQQVTKEGRPYVEQLREAMHPNAIQAFLLADGQRFFRILVVVVITFLFLYWMTCPGSGISFRDLASWVAAAVQHSGRFVLLSAYVFIFLLWKLPFGVVSFLLSSPASYLFLALWVVSAIVCYQRTKTSAGEFSALSAWVFFGNLWTRGKG